MIACRNCMNRGWCDMQDWLKSLVGNTFFLINSTSNFLWEFKNDEPVPESIKKCGLKVHLRHP